LNSFLETTLSTEQATLDLGGALAGQLEIVGCKSGNGAQIHLHGGLGAGKTTMVRGLLRSLGVGGPVKSPTYTLVEPYQFTDMVVYHFDLYRLGSPEELEFIGFSDYCHPGAVCCVEWPQRGQGWLPQLDLGIQLETGMHSHRALLTAHTELGEALLKGIHLPR